MTMSMQYRLFWIMLAEMSEAGVPLPKALNIISCALPAGKFLEVVKMMSHDIENDAGDYSLANAMQKSGAFSSIEVTLARASSAYDDVSLSTVARELASNRLPCRSMMYDDFYYTLGTLLSNRVYMLPALKKCAENTEGLFKAAIEKIHDGVKEAGSFSVLMKESGEFSDFEVELVDLGEDIYNSVDFHKVLLRLSKMSSQLFDA